MAGNVTALAPRESAPADLASIDLTAIERVIVAGDLSKLTPEQRWDYYKGVCHSVGLNPFTKPFEYITLNGKLTLYALKGATDQLRGRYGISLDKPTVDISDGLCMVSVSASGSNGRCDTDMGAVSIDNLRGEAKANAIMKAITKAKRRVTLSFCGLGMLDETEIESIPSARPADVETIPTGVQLIATEQERARAMVDGPDAGTVAALREEAIARCHQLAAHAETVKHEKAAEIARVKPEKLSDQKLRQWVEKLDAMFPDVDESGAVPALTDDGDEPF
jgi:hypothetical protein